MNNINSINKIYTLILILLLLISNYAVADSVANNINLTLQSGDYLGTSFIDILKKTRSPLYSIEHSDSQPNMQVTVSEDGKHYRLKPFDFHYGDSTYESDASFKDVKLEGQKVNKVIAEVKIISRTDFIFFSNWDSVVDSESSKDLSFKEVFKSEHYFYIDNLKQFINRFTIAGKYKDSDGHSYIFTEEGEAIFPENKFPYEVSLDFFSQGYDSIRIGVKEAHITRGQYAYKVNKNTLQLFKIVGEFIDEPDALPFLNLTRTDEEKK